MTRKPDDRGLLRAVYTDGSLAPILDTRLALLREYARMCWDDSEDTDQPLKRRPWPIPVHTLSHYLQVDLDTLERLGLLPGQKERVT